MYITGPAPAVCPLSQCLSSRNCALYPLFEFRWLHALTVGVVAYNPRTLSPRRRFQRGTERRLHPNLYGKLTRTFLGDVIRAQTRVYMWIIAARMWVSTPCMLTSTQNYAHDYVKYTCIVFDDHKFGFLWFLMFTVMSFLSSYRWTIDWLSVDIPNITTWMFSHTSMAYNILSICNKSRTKSRYRPKNVDLILDTFITSESTITK